MLYGEKGYIMIYLNQRSLFPYKIQSTIVQGIHLINIETLKSRWEGTFGEYSHKVNLHELSMVRPEQYYDNVGILFALL